ncbi:MAG: oxidoreductase [Pirellulales bacterium]|nr:oxidoreductase [Pirellulales bacterium]
MGLFGVGLMVLIGGGFLSLGLSKTPKTAAAVACFTAVGGSLLVLVGGLAVLCSGSPVEVRFAWHVPFGSCSFGLDPLSCVFVLPIAAVVAVAAVYGREYLEHSCRPSMIGVSWFFFNLLAATMLLVVAARNGLLFLVCWEAMSLASFFLVMSDYEREEVRRAGWIYLAATHLGTSLLLVLFLLLGRKSGSLDFDQFSSEPALAGTLFVLALVGFGTKAGFIPVHVWLPEAHPAAPSHVSAVMSGVMIKTGIYGLLRTLTFLGQPPAWWGWTLVGIGAASGILGILFALSQRDLKRLLAYSSVENIGIIALGLGTGLLGITHRVPAMAALGLLGALVHVLNHALFKGLLFLGAGAVQHGAATRELDRLGGLLKRMPVTGATFLVGACAVCGLPPLNGFLSELLIYLGVLAGVAEQRAAVSWAMLCVLVIGTLALVGGFAAVCFTKAFGAVFLGEPRSDASRHAHEVGPAMRYSLVTLAAACVLVALSAPLWPLVFRSAALTIVPATFRAETAAAAGRATVPLAAAAAAFLAFLAASGVLAAVRKRLLAGRRIDRGPTWDCGYAAPTARMQYTASSYTGPLVVLFRMFVRPRVDLRPPEGLFPIRGRYASQVPDLFREYFFGPVFAGIAWVASRLRWLQQGRIQLYVLYIALTVLVLLVWKLG